MPHICVIVEGAYPYVTGGVAQWLQWMLTELSDIEFSIVTISAETKREQDYKYKLPPNVVKLVNLNLNDENLLRIPKKRPKVSLKYKNNAWEIIRAFYEEMEKGQLERFSQVYRILGEEKILDIEELLLSKNVWELITHCYELKSPVEPFIEYYWSWRTYYLLLYKLFLFNLPQADLYHSISTGYAGVLGAIAKLKYNIPFILTEHGIYTYEREMEIEHVDWIKGYQKDMWIKMFEMMGKIAYLYSDKIISLFENARKSQVELGAIADKTEVIPNGININKFIQVKKTSNNDGKFRIALVGRVVPIKDVMTFISACKIIDSALPNSEFYIIGSYDENREYYAQCKGLAEELGISDKCIFTGKVDIEKYYPLIDVIVMTSIRESQPLTVLEAMAVGIPIVTTKVGSLPEILEDAGIIVFPKDVQAIADGVIKFISDETFREIIIRKAKVKVAEKYNIAKVIQRYREIYTQMGKGVVNFEIPSTNN